MGPILKLKLSHPIGTNKLPKIIRNIRQTIIECGGEFLFNSKVTDIIIKNSCIDGVVLKNGSTINSQKVIQQSALVRDIFELLHYKKIKIESKPFDRVRVDIVKN